MSINRIIAIAASIACFFGVAFSGRADSATAAAIFYAIAMWLSHKDERE